MVGGVVEEIPWMGSKLRPSLAALWGCVGAACDWSSDGRSLGC